MVLPIIWSGAIVQQFADGSARTLGASFCAQTPTATGPRSWLIRRRTMWKSRVLEGVFGRPGFAALRGARTAAAASGVHRGVCVGAIRRPRLREEPDRDRAGNGDGSE